jgi:hypothetical protein
MKAHQLRAIAIALGLATGCGGQSPSAPSSLPPSSPPGVGPAATQTIIGATLSQATNMVVTAVPGGGPSAVLTYACPGGGSMTMTYDATLPSGPSGTMTTSSRMDVTDCRSQNVTTNGDPYLSVAGEYVFAPVTDGVPSTMTATMRTSGGLRFDAAGTPGRARYDCTQVMSLELGDNGTPPKVSIASSGAITWEQPLGTVTVRPCGP